MEPLFPLFLTVPRRGSRMRTQSLVQQLRAAIRSGRLHAGSRLPATRVLARMAGVSRNTVLLAYEALVAQGLAVSRRGSGTFVAPSAGKTDDPPAPLTTQEDRRLNPLYHGRRVRPPTVVAEGAYDFRVGIPDWRSFPFDVWRRLTARALRASSPAIANYGDPRGLLPLREALAAQIASTRAISCSPQDIVVTAGAQQAFDLLSRILVTRPGAAVAVENPGYSGSRAAFAAAGAEIVPIRVDEEGMQVGAIPPHVRVVSVTPSHQYPLGSQLSEGRRHELLQFAREHDALVIEDDYDGEFRFTGRSLDALKTLDRDDRIFYVGTFSKTLLPSLRLGYVIAPAWARGALAYARQCADQHSPAIAQAVLAAFIDEGHMGRHLSRMRRIYQARCEQLMVSLHRHCDGLLAPFAPAAGMHLVALLAEGTDAKATSARCRQGGIAINSLSDCWGRPPEVADARHGIRADPRCGDRAGRAEVEGAGVSCGRRTTRVGAADRKRRALAGRMKPGDLVSEGVSCPTDCSSPGGRIPALGSLLEEKGRPPTLPELHAAFIMRRRIRLGRQGQSSQSTKCSQRSTQPGSCKS